MTSLAELAYMPVTGSFSTYATKFVDPSLGFALGWNYWYNWAITIAAELAAVTLIMKFWFPDTPSLIWSGLCLAIIFLLNYLSVKGFGESEYWFALIKVVTIIIFLIVGFMMIFGIMGAKLLASKTSLLLMHHLTVVSWQLSVYLWAGFSFKELNYLGNLGETSDPERNIESNSFDLLAYSFILYSCDSRYRFINSLYN